MTLAACSRRLGPEESAQISSPFVLLASQRTGLSESEGSLRALSLEAFVFPSREVRERAGEARRLKALAQSQDPGQSPAAAGDAGKRQLGCYRIPALSQEALTASATKSEGAGVLSRNKHRPCRGVGNIKTVAKEQLLIGLFRRGSARAHQHIKSEFASPWV